MKRWNIFFESLAIVICLAMLIAGHMGFLPLNKVGFIMTWLVLGYSILQLIRRIYDH